MNYNNYRIKTATGHFYQSFKEPTPGADAVVLKDGSGTRYHKKYNYLKGKLRGVTIQEPPFGGKWLKIEFQENEDTRGSIQVPLLSYGSIDGWAKAIALTLGNLEVGQEYQFGLNRKNKDDKGYLYKNFYVNLPGGEEAGEPVKWAIDPKAAPAWEKVKDDITGEDVWSGKAQTKWYYDYIIGQVARLAPQRSSAPVQEGQEVLADDAFGPDEGVTGGDYSELPF